MTSPAANAVLAPYQPLPWQRKPFLDKSPVMLLEGSAGGGKSRLYAEKVHAFMMKYPGATGLMLRKAREFASKSIVPFMARTVIGPDPRVQIRKSESCFIYENGSVLYWGGMKDEAQRESIRSIGQEGGLDIVWMEEGTAFVLEDFEEVLARMRGTAAPWTQIGVTTNPGAPSHWIYQRLIKGGEAIVYRSAESDNPHNPASYKESLRKITGIRKQRLVDGKWVQAEGVVYTDYDANVHLIEPFEIPADWRRFCVVDFGYTNPFVCQWWALDPDDRMYLFREIYMTQRIVEDHASEIKRLIAGVERAEWDEMAADMRDSLFRERNTIEVFVCDHDAEDRATLERYGINNTVRATKDVSPGIQAVQQRLRVAGDGKPRLFMMRGALIEEDSRLVDAKKPVSTVDEIESYIWEKAREGKTEKENPVKADDHGMDAMRYGVMYVDSMDRYKMQRSENPFY